MQVLTSFVAALVLTAVQAVPHFIGEPRERNRRLIHSAAGGVAVAFVFLHLLPEVDALRDAVQERTGAASVFDAHAIFVLGLVGLSVFYGVEVLARASHRRAGTSSSIADQVGIMVFAAYYSLIGYLLWEQAQESLPALTAYTIAVALHLVVVDYGLRDNHREAYTRVGWWVLAAAMLIGWAAGAVVHIPDWGVGIMMALFAGALILVALKEELPAERSGHYGAFIAGVVAYSALLTVV